jgi:hypothetical protein
MMTLTGLVRADRAAVNVKGAAALFIVSFASSWLAHLLILPPLNLAPIDPSGGIALAAALIWGRRAAVVVGVATFTGWMASGVAKPLMPLVLSLAVTGQAVLGGALVERALRGKLELTEPKDIVSLLVLGGPIACAAGALLAMAAYALLPTSQPIHSAARQRLRPHWSNCICVSPSML